MSRLSLRRAAVALTVLFATGMSAAAPARASSARAAASATANRDPEHYHFDEWALVHAATRAGLRPVVLRLALKAHTRAVREGLTHRPILTVIDYSLRSRIPRLWVLDLAGAKILAHELVAHGRGSGDDSAYVFSNRPGSLQSSLGTLITGGTYHGKHGRSLRLYGIDPGLNDNAEQRAIVVHGAEYVNAAVAEKLGRLGRSQGCPALSPTAARHVIDLIGGGTVLFAYYPSALLERTLADRAG